jgi:molybdopterin converting factor small subunit
MVEVYLPSILSKSIESNRLIISANNVNEVVKFLVNSYGEIIERQFFDQKGEWIRFWQIFVNGINIRFLDYFETKLKKEDKVVFLPVVGGG